MADYVIEGSRIGGIPDLYAELNRLFMTGEDWQLGASLDALDDTIQRQLDDLRAGTGLTYFERVLDVFADHPQVTLDLR